MKKSDVCKIKHKKNPLQRLISVPPMLDECLEFLENRAKSNFTYEVIVVSDGSTDRTVDVANEYSKKYGTGKVRVLALEKNRGKGGAVRLVCIHKII